MNRKYFLSSVLTVGAALSAKPGLGGVLVTHHAVSRHRIPPYLKPGDTIGITSPASYISLEEIGPAVQQLEKWGFKIIIGKTVGQRDFTYGGTDEERRADLQAMLDQPDIRAIMCARGGYGVVRIIDQLDFQKFKKHPKWVIGFSDITVLHCHINRHYGIATLHSKMCNSFPADLTNAQPEQLAAINSIGQTLLGEELSFTAPASPFNRPGHAEAVLVGGNLSMITTLAGTTSDLDTRGKILFIEDTGEYLYNIDRMCWNLKRSGKLKDLAGLIIGGFNIKADTPGEEFGKTIYEIILEKISEYDYPVCFNFPVGHQRNNVALKCGIPHLLEITTAGSSLRSLP